MTGRPFFGWWVVFASAIGMATGIASVNVFAFGVFQKPLMAEFGWSATQVSGVLLVVTLVTVVSSPFIGAAVDRLGARRVAIFSIAMLAALLGSLYWLTANLWHFYLVFALTPILAAGTSSVAYARVVARWFERRRGLALGLTLAGMGLGGVVVPRLSNWLIDAYGWRVGYVGLGLLSLCVTLPLVVALLRDSPEAMGQRPDGAAPEPLDSPGAATSAAGAREPSRAAAPAPLGLEVRDALRHPTMWLLIVAFAVLGIAIGGVMVPLVPILEDRGLDRSDAIAIAGLLGVSLVVGRVVAGALMDRFHAPYVAVGFLLGPIVGLSLLASGVSGPAAYAAAILIGLAAGAEVDVIAYMVGRYFGTRSYATLYGVLYSAWTFGSGFGPLASATSFDRMGSYGPALAAYVVAMVVACVLLLRLGPYPRFEARSVDPVPAAATAVR